MLVSLVSKPSNRCADRGLHVQAGGMHFSLCFGPNVHISDVFTSK